MDSEHDLWIFAYGSLMWRPGFAYAEARRARLDGHSRCFCVVSVHHRGSLTRPGLVLGLDRGGVCEGIAYRVVAADAAVTLAYLRAREQVNGVYREARVRVDIHGEPGRSEVAVAYIVERAHPSYAGRLPLAVQARIIRGGKGLSGVNLDYVINTLSHMGQIGIRERELERLLTVLGGYFARGGSVNHVSRRAEILRRAVSHQRVTHRCARPMRPAERRRFRHRMSNRAR